MAKRLHFFNLILVAFLSIVLCGCDSIHYYGQAIHGQATIISKRRPISRILKSADSPEGLKNKLRHILNIRRFASQDLFLPTGKNYLTYVNLNRPYVVWNVFAAPEFSFTPKAWRYPVIGRATYRGYFSEKSARNYAEKLKKKNWDVYIAPVTAYSTLGWFNDPVLNTILNRTEAGLARIIFHELAHQVLYVKGDTTFNESFATAVEQEGIRRWAKATGQTGVYDEYLSARKRQQDFTTLVLSYGQRLDKLYRQKLPDQEKRMKKKQAIDSLRFNYRKVKERWGGYAGYDHWFETSINNAKINTVATYHELVPAFNQLLDKSGSNLKKFYENCRKLAQKPQEKRRRALKHW